MRGLLIVWLLAGAGCHAIFPLEPSEFGAPERLPLGNCDNPSLTGDQLELYMSCDRVIYVARRARIGDPWVDVVMPYIAQGGAAETTPEVASDGQSMYVSFSASGVPEGLDINERKRTSELWGALVELPSINALGSRDAAGNRTADDTLVVLSSNRDGKVDLYQATRTDPDLDWSPASPILGVNTGADEGSPFLADDGLTLYFHREVGGGEFDLFVARRATRSAVFDEVTALEDLDDGFSEQDPWISADGKHLYFYSNRPDPGPGIYYSRRE